MSSNQRRGSGKEEKNDVRANEESKPNSPKNIPHDIVVEILSRLPLDSLFRFACVSKPWCSSISNITPTKIGRQMVLVNSKLKSGNLILHTIDQECNVKMVPTPTENTSPGSRNPVIFSPCNGLLLMGIGDGLFLWNPLTRYFKKVLSYEFLGQDAYLVVGGLCYDSSTDEYKALMAVTRNDHDAHGFVVVGSFRSKTWTRVDFPYRVWTVKAGSVVNGHLHWYVAKRDCDFPETCNQIVYFDPLRNEFFKVRMPEPKEGDGDEVFGLGVLDGCLCMARIGDFNGIELLVLKEYGVKKSWTIMFIITDLKLWGDDQLVPLGYTNNGEALMKVSKGDKKGWKIMAYDPDDSLRRTISFQPKCYYVNAFMYEESLVTPTGYDWEEDELKGGATYVEYLEDNKTPRTMRKTRDGFWRCLRLEKNGYWGESEDESNSEVSNSEDEYEPYSEDDEYQYSFFEDYEYQYSNFLEGYESDMIEYGSDFKESDSEED